MNDEEKEVIARIRANYPWCIIIDCTDIIDHITYKTSSGNPHGHYVLEGLRFWCFKTTLDVDEFIARMELLSSKRRKNNVP
jgi:hypothetical protein